jgi:hypothetical protein
MRWAFALGALLSVAVLSVAVLVLAFRLPGRSATPAPAERAA